MQTTMRKISTGQDLVMAAVSDLVTEKIHPTDSAIVAWIRKVHIITSAQVEIWKSLPPPPEVKP